MSNPTGFVAAGSAGLDRAVERLIKTRVMLWVLLGLMLLSAVQTFSLHMRWTGWVELLGLGVAALLLLNYGDALAKLRLLRNQQNLERTSSAHALVWAAMAVSAVWQLL